VPHNPDAYPYELRRGPGHLGFTDHSRGLDEAVDVRCPSGTPIYTPLTPSDGRWLVTVSEDLGNHSYGRWIEITGPTTLRYAHLSRRKVSRRMRLEPGVLLGQTGDTGNSFGDHLHLEAPDDIYRWARRIWTPAPKGDWLDMATSEEVETIVRKVVREEVKRWGEVFAEWAMAATTKTILGREAPHGYNNTLSATYKQVIAESLAAAKTREAAQHP